MNKLKSLLVLAMLLISAGVYATEGMWLPFLLMQNEKDMKSMGMKISAEDIYSVNQASLKDAIVHFGGFCTGEVISNRGLVLTNHHCGYGAIQSHSSVENDYLKKGFWARNNSEELPNKGLFVAFIKYMEDVTVPMFAGITDEMTEEQKQAVFAENARKLEEAHKAKNGYEIAIKPIYYGNQFILIAMQKYTDIRLVGAPPSSIGKFGSDTDNWMWPRHTGDFSIFRIYADANNNPAEYSESNVPFQPIKHLSISLKGIEKDDFTMVFGFPGRTEEYLPLEAVEQVTEDLNPARIEVRRALLAELDKRMRSDDEVRIKYAAKYASIANAYKKWIGQNLGIERTGGLEAIAKEQSDFITAVQKNEKWKASYGNLIPEMNKLIEEQNNYAVGREYIVEILIRGWGLASFAGSFDKLINLAHNGSEEEVRAFIDTQKDKWDEFYKDYDKSVDRQVAKTLLNLWATQKRTQLIPESIAPLAADEELETLLNAIYDFGLLPNREEFYNALETDPVGTVLSLENEASIQLYKQVIAWYTEVINPKYQSLQLRIDDLQKTYMKAQMEVFNKKKFYPDANSTLRLTYGKVDGYEPADGVAYDFKTTLDGVMQKYVPGDYEFDVDPKLIELYNTKDYGQYARKDGKLSVCFIASNHTSGGNSGSPALNAKGELIGLNFDRVWEGTMSDLYYDPSICRNVMVDIRYVLFVVDKFAGAGYLLNEMTIVK